jgi:hypothetical protein
MSTDSDVRNRIVLDWLREDAHENPERVLLRALDEIETTRQRRSLWPPRRSTIMNRLALASIAAAAVVAVAILGYNLLPRTPGTGGEPTPSPSVGTSLRPTPIPFLPVGSVPPGTYRSVGYSSTPFSVTLPAGWTSGNGFISKGDADPDSEGAGDPFTGSGVSLASWVVSHIYTDSCDWQGALQAAASPEDIVRRLSEQTGHDTTGPTSVTTGGFPATRFEFSVASDFDVNACDDAFMRLWPDAGPNENFGLPIYPGMTARVDVVDVNGDPSLLIAFHTEQASAEDRAELEAVARSVQFLP